MKRILTILILGALCLLYGCSRQEPTAQVVATTLPVYEFAAAICQNTDIQVQRLITESVSCLHDYTLQVRQTQALEDARIVILSGAGLEDFFRDTIPSGKTLIDASEGIELHCESGGDHKHDHGHSHSHEEDPHIWLSVDNARQMAQSIFRGLAEAYPEHRSIMEENLNALNEKLDALADYRDKQLSALENLQIITFHDGFSYLAEECGITILRAIEEESGSEASARELISVIRLVQEHNVSAIFTEINGSVSAADVVSNETGVAVYPLDMAMGGSSYFDAMYHNYDTLKEALE